MWRDGDDAPSWTGRGLVPELAVWTGQLGPGPAALIDVSTGRVEVTEITEDEDGVLRWTLSGLEGSASPLGVVQWGPIAIHPSTDGRPDIQPVDPVALVRRRVDRLTVQRPTYVEFQLDGELKSVSSPIPLELPAAWRTENKALVERVRAALSHAPTPGQVSLSAALRDGLGDCNEMAALYVRYAIERGWVARPVAGVAYVTDPEPALALHAWAEVWVGGSWVAVDPALNQPLADATHLKLAEDTELWRALIRLNGFNSLGIVTIR